MPIDTIQVARVSQRWVGFSHRQRKYDVTAELPPGSSWAPTFETFDPLKATLCDRARIKGWSVQIGWKDSRYGREIVTVELVKETARVEVEAADRSGLADGGEERSPEDLAADYPRGA